MLYSNVECADTTLILAEVMDGQRKTLHAS